MTGPDVLTCVRSLVTASPFDLTEAPEPFSFDRVPAQLPTDAVRLELRQVGVVGGFSWSEERTDDLDLWIARQVDLSDPTATYAGLLTLANSLTSAVAHAATAGDFVVLESGRRAEVEQPDGAAYQVLRLTLPVSYMLTV